MAEATGNGGKSDNAFRTIGEVSAELGLAQHILRYWETRFPQLRPLTRAGNRRYYRPEDVALLRRIDGLLRREGYTIKGVQKMLAGKDGAHREAATPRDAATVSGGTPPLLAELSRIRTALAAALAD